MAVTTAKGTKELRAPSIVAELGVSRVLAIAVLVLVASVVQMTLLPLATLLGVIPQLVLVVTLSLAYVDGERVGVVTGFMGGLFLDLLVPQTPIGVYALLYTLIGYAVARYRQYSSSEGVWTPVVVVALASAAAELGYSVLGIMFGLAWISLAYTAKVAGLVVLYNTLLTPFVFPLVAKIAGRVRPEGTRW